jgi:dTDP-4-dehydrorhamnose 3,5-epimerase
VVRGKILDVFVDLRKDSPTFGEWGSVELSADNKRMVYIPKGFAHGFSTLTDHCDVVYKVDNYYAPDNEGAIGWDDSDLDIDWPINNPVISDKDEGAGSFEQFVDQHGSLETNHSL